jgi:CubicO group peptidase (beta-lactamase class C family)
MLDHPSTPTIHGFAAPGYESVAAAFARNFTELGDVGAAFSVVRDGALVVDLWGGAAAPGRPWAQDTLQVIFSGTKGLAATCMLMLVDRGQLDLARPVTHYWPEFAAGGKGGLLMRELVSHRSGLPGITRETLSSADLTDDEGMENRLAAEPLSSDPNARCCYNALTIRWLCGGVLRRIEGRSIGRFFAEEVAAPLGLDIWIGLPETQEKRVGLLQLGADWTPWDHGLNPQQAADPTRISVWANPPLFPADGLPWNGRAYHASEIPGAGAIASARSLARLYGCLANGGTLDGVRLMRRETLLAGRRELNRFADPFLAQPMAFATAYALQTEKARFGPPPDAFGHAGAGGSIHCAWPSERIGLSYVMNEMRADPDDLRTLSLLETLHGVVEESGHG